MNRTSGATSISNPAGNTGPISINGYSILSSLGALDPSDGRWNSLDDQNVGGANAWLEAPPGGSTTDLSELNPLSSTTLAVNGAPLNLGTPYVQRFPTFGTHPDHLVFEYNVVGGTSTVTGVVAYQGTETKNNFLLTVNTSTGAVQMKNDSPYDIFIDGYAVTSISGSLRTENGRWSSLQDQSVSGWEELSPTTSAASEGKQNGYTRLTPGSGYNLGTLFYTDGQFDLDLQFLQVGASQATHGVVAYTTSAIPAVPAPTAGVLGDFNNNGSVDAADYVLWRKSVGTYTILRNDPVGGQIGAGQYNLWRANFGNSTAGGAGASLAVPEPGCLLLLISVTALLGSSRKIGRRHCTRDH